MRGGQNDARPENHAGAEARLVGAARQHHDDVIGEAERLRRPRRPRPPRERPSQGSPPPATPARRRSRKRVVFVRIMPLASALRPARASPRRLRGIGLGGNASAIFISHSGGRGKTSAWGVSRRFSSPWVFARRGPLRAGGFAGERGRGACRGQAGVPAAERDARGDQGAPSSGAVRGAQIGGGAIQGGGAFGQALPSRRRIRLRDCAACIATGGWSTW